jgi:Ni2+-binding GTPase involved in maturation of urease and hydrogenase
MKRMKFVMIGGFLGAGKTTAIARLAQHYVDQGLKVGVVTNDQAYDLVDTHSLRAQGFRVGEVPGACFCCKFNDLIATADALQQDEVPDVIIAEPVGSCTDLVATVIEPLRHLHGDQYELAPLAVLLKPEHGQKILRGQSGLGFSPKAAYIFLKQIEEADVIVINKIDKLSSEERTELAQLLSERWPGKRLLAMSARSGEGFDQLIALLDRPSDRREVQMEVDYDIYAEGEAELGWLNCQATLEKPDGALALDEVLLALVARLRDALVIGDAEPAHLKVLGQIGEETGIANLVGGDAGVELSLASHSSAPKLELIVNARVAMAPEDLEQVVRAAVAALGLDFSATATIHGMQRFRPGRPVPTHRVGAS